MPTKHETLSPAQRRRLEEAVAEEEAAKADTLAQVRETTARMGLIDDIVVALAQARHARGISGAEAARRMGVNRSMVSRLEAAGHGAAPRLDTLLAYAEAIGVEVRIALVETDTGEAVEPHPKPQADADAA